jgi:defect-in-organelle-trafficking protein DotD
MKQLADNVQLRLKVIGREPAIPVTVSLRKRDASVYEVLQDIRGQVGNRADIMVFPSSGVIELHYI